MECLIEVNTSTKHLSHQLDVSDRRLDPAGGFAAAGVGGEDVFLYCQHRRGKAD